MTDAIIWADKLPDIIKKWILVVPMMFAFLGGGAGIYQTYAKGAALEEAENAKNKAIHEVAIGFQSVIAEKQEIPQVRNSTCGNCKTLMQGHVREFHQ